MDYNAANKNEKFDPVEVVSLLFKNLLKREQEVLKRRFALDGATRDTLEKIGCEYAITRERVRQIEASGLRKIRVILKDEKEKLNARIVEDTMETVLSEYGGIMREDLMLDEVLGNVRSSRDDRYRKNLLFLLTYLLEEHDRIMRAEANISHEPFWYLSDIEIEKVRSSIDTLVNFLSAHGNPVVLDELIGKIRVCDPGNEANQGNCLYMDNNFENNKFRNFVLSQLNISKSVNQNILDQWGLVEWSTVVPRRMNDKIYLVLKKENKPLHFAQIAEKINEINFDRKKAYPATVHNELILDPKYILVGRGVYALREWGYTDGTVSEVIRKFLEKEAKPFSKDEIMEEVLKQRLVRKATIALALNDRNKFRIDENGRYSLV
ncbi:hypothetical protein A2Y83_02710 [Candidatus Falkowbacteria bacterium RBG_13_39_14]|uniref:HTH HARE-type domain-containing protein n=1 Tax=Candidatus Falkowbacteria bacterium RBG_13_39_14 TaxID=1797985 RepID=A0A1F5S5J5_9BACT|nr:MAG: hypothetical protein A2Y83_02710 [Candidatus Falkowbacteria bacterium RBG_13_39_14]